MSELEEIADYIQDTLRFIVATKALPQWQVKAERRLQSKLSDVFEKAAQSVMNELEQRGLPSDTMTRRQIMQELVDARDEMVEIVQTEAVDAGEHGFNKAIDDLRKEGVAIPKPGQMLEETRKEIANKAFQATEKTMRRLKGDVMETLAKAYEDGLGIDDARELIRGKFDSMKSYELERIARTEIQTAQDKVAHDTLKNMGTKYEKWVTAQDARVRDGTTTMADHVALHGEITAIDQPFSNGLKYPGDTSGPIEEWINCRCRVVPFIMPPGMQPPPGVDRFTEADIISTER